MEILEAPDMYIIIESKSFASQVIILGNVILNKDLEFANDKIFKYRILQPNVVELDEADEDDAKQAILKEYQRY